MKQQLNEVQKLQKIAGVINEDFNKDIIDVLLQWINKVDIQKYKSAYDFKEAIKQKVLSLKK